jgi:hypothetical protein
MGQIRPIKFPVCDRGGQQFVEWRARRFGQIEALCAVDPELLHGRKLGRRSLDADRGHALTAQRALYLAGSLAHAAEQLADFGERCAQFPVADLRRQRRVLQPR